MTVVSHGPNGSPPRSSAPRAAPAPTTAVTPTTPTAPAPPFRTTALPTPPALALVHAARRDLEQALQRGATPDVDALVGWEFRGINCTPQGAPPLSRMLGVQKFIKGMFRAGDGRAMGYNSPVAQNVLDGRWHTRPSEEAPRRFGFYLIAPVDPTSLDNAYLHAVLLDYGRGGNRGWDPTRGLRDYLVQVDADNPDLFLGKAYYALGSARPAIGYFVLERFRPGPHAV